VGRSRPARRASIPNAEGSASLGILGATVMPHNLYLHTASSRPRHRHDVAGKRRRSVTTRSTPSSFPAPFFVVRRSAAAVFNRAGH
jgi:Mn2+/Fe2+ NRAMP family transporter